MERNGDDGIVGENSQPRAECDGQASAMSSTLFLDHVGQVILTFNSDGLSWKLVKSFNSVSSFTFFSDVILVFCKLLSEYFIQLVLIFNLYQTGIFK